MQDIFGISKGWHDPVPGLNRLTFLALAVLAVEALAFLLGRGGLPWNPIYVLALTRAVDAGILLFWGPRWFKGPDSAKHVREALAVAGLVVLAGLLFLVLWKLVFGASFLKTRPGTLGRDFLPALTFLLTACLISPLAEELLFRGLLYRRLRARLNPWIAAAAISLLFALTHALFTPGAAAALMPFVGSLIFCAGYEKSKFILTPILLHAGGNLLIFISPLTGLT